MIYSAGNVIWIGVILLCLEITWSQGKPAGDDSDVILAKRQQQEQQLRKVHSFHFKVGDKTFALAHAVPGLSSDQARDWCQGLRDMVDFDHRGFPIYLRGDLPSSDETLTKMGKVLSKRPEHADHFVKYWNEGKRAYELDEFRYTLLNIDHFNIKERVWADKDKLLVSLPQEAEPGNEAENETGNEAGRCVYSTSSWFGYEKIETKACKSLNKMFVCQMELEKES